MVKDEGDPFSFQKTNFGTTSPGPIFKALHPIIDKDMKALNDRGELNFATYEVIYLGDGKVTPTEKHFDDVLKVNRFCSGGQKDSFCAGLIAMMKEEWGDPDLNTVEAIDLQLSMLQSLPQYYGSGLVNVNFIRRHPEPVIPQNREDTVFDKVAKAAKARFSHIKRWDVAYGGEALNLLPVSDTVRTYKMTHLYVYNPNVRVDKDQVLKNDSDGDGLFDERELELGFDPLKQRTWGYCLDSLMSKDSFRGRCEAFANSKSCDPKLDSDLDGLNQCEEIVLGTDSFGFDTDGDTIPDSLEWLYSYNPLKPEKGADTSGDGVPNLLNFSAGLGGKHYFDKIPDAYKARYSVDFKGYEEVDDPEQFFKVGEVNP